MPAEVEDVEPSDEELAAMMADDSSYRKATSKKNKIVAHCYVKEGRGVKKSLAEATPRMTAAAAAAASLTPVPIQYNGIVNGRDEWELLEEVRTLDAVLNCTLIAPKGYKFDLASVPRPLWGIIGPFDLSILAPLFHDLIYEFRGNLPGPNYVHPYPYPQLFQKDADDLFLRLMIREGVSRWKRNIAYAAVRAAGWTYWNT